jgi:hypothetical protein
VSLHRTKARLATWAGLMVGAPLWAVNMEAGQILPTFDCTKQLHLSGFISGAFTALTLFAAIVSWRSAHVTPMGFGSPRTLRFDAALSASGALVFAFALFLQSIIPWVLTGCER